jgi:hypothetical protein
VREHTGAHSLAASLSCNHLFFIFADERRLRVAEFRPKFTAPTSLNCAEIRSTEK